MTPTSSSEESSNVYNMPTLKLKSFQFPYMKMKYPSMNSLLMLLRLLFVSLLILVIMALFSYPMRSRRDPSTVDPPRRIRTRYQPPLYFTCTVWSLQGYTQIHHEQLQHDNHNDDDNILDPAAQSDFMILQAIPNYQLIPKIDDTLPAYTRVQWIKQVIIIIIIIFF